MTSKHVNENYIHICESAKVDVLKKICSISKMGFTKDEVIEIIEFYLFNAPVLKTDKMNNPFGLKSLKDYKWYGTKDMSALEGKLLSAAGISYFCFIKSNTIEGTLEGMDLGNKMCTDHPRAVIRQNVKVSSFEDGTTEIRQQETRMECLFRHLRNSIAHNLTYLFDNDNILIEDRDDNGEISARILAPKTILLDWMTIVKSKQPESKELSVDDQ